MKRGENHSWNQNEIKIARKKLFFGTQQKTVLRGSLAEEEETLCEKKSQSATYTPAHIEKKSRLRFQTEHISSISE